MQQWVMDTETYQNFHLIMVKNLETGEVRYWDQYPGKQLNIKAASAFLEDSNNEIIGFNSGRYDLPLLSYSLTGKTCQEIKDASDAIIVGEMAPWIFEEHFGCQPLKVNHIDLYDPAPGVNVSLKSYGARMHCAKLQDLPIEPSAEISPVQRTLLRTYCINDLDTTEALYRAIIKQVDLRRVMSQQYGVDLRSKSDAQIAEAVIKLKVSEATGQTIRKSVIEPGTSYRYKAPGFIDFQTDQLKDVLKIVKSAKFIVSPKGAIELPEEIAKLKIVIGTSCYQMGIGGLHSTEKSTAQYADENHILVDRDVASYYPSIILRLGLYPANMGEAFLYIYRGFVNQRLAAKRSGDKVVADSFKILLNGSFGKFGSKYSALYSPNLLIQTTLTGQLALLQLIEQLEMRDIHIVSANTDGIVIRCHRSKVSEMESIIALWEWFSCFETEATEYIALYSKDVNNYLAIKPDGSTKAKGLYAEAGLMKNPTSLVCVDAVKAALTTGASIESSIRSCENLTRFITVRAVRGGGVQGADYLGKTVRWYYSTGSRNETINYRSNGNKVAKSDGANPVMQLPDTLPNDIDYDRYIDEARSILSDIGLS